MKNNSKLLNNKEVFSLRTLSWLAFASVFTYFQISAQDGVYIESFPDSSRYFAPTPVFSLENAGFFYSIFVRAIDVFPGITFAQMLFSTIAWLFLSFSVLKFFSGWIGLFCAIATLSIASQESVTNWNNLVLSESTSISSMAIWLAAILVFLKPANRVLWFRVQYSFLIATSFLMIFNRPQALIFVLPTCVAFAVAYRKRFVFWDRILYFTTTSVLLFASGLRVAALAQGSPFTSAYAQHLLEFRPPFTRYAFEQAGCVPPEVTHSDPSYAQLISACPNIETLIAEERISFTTWAIHSPFETLTTFVEWMRNGAIFVNYSSVNTVINKEHANSLMGVGYPFLLICLYFALITFLLVVISGFLYGFRFSGKRLTISVGFITLLLSYVLLTWGVDGIEMPRHTLPVLLFIPLVLAAAILYTFVQDKVNNLRMRQTKH